MVTKLDKLTILLQLQRASQCENYYKASVYSDRCQTDNLLQHPSPVKVDNKDAKIKEFMMGTPTQD